MNSQPMPEPVYTSKQEIEREAQALLRRYRAYGWSEGQAEQSAAEFYAYQMHLLKRREAVRG
jgi:hypothetical protein